MITIGYEPCSLIIIISQMGFFQGNDHNHVINNLFDKHYEKNGCFAIGLAIQFLNCKTHLQLIVFIRCEC